MDHINFKPDSTNIAFENFSREWEVMRRVIFANIRRYASTYSLSQHVIHVTDQVMGHLRVKGTLVPKEYCNRILFNSMDS